MKLAVFPKCYMDELCVHRTMSVFEWIEMARELQPFGVSGLEFYTGFLLDDNPSYLGLIRQKLINAGFEMPKTR